MRKPRSDLERQPETCKRELHEAREHLVEALEQQAATSEVLRVISGSPDDLQPVLETMLAHATRLCEASYGALWLSDGDAFRIAALHGAEGEVCSCAGCNKREEDKPKHCIAEKTLSLAPRLRCFSAFGSICGKADGFSCLELCGSLVDGSFLFSTRCYHRF